MDIYKPEPGSDFRIKVTRGIAATTILLLLPFLVYHVFKGNVALVVGSIVVISIFALIFRSSCQTVYDERYALFALAPAILAHLMYSFLSLGVLATYWSYPAIFTFFFMLSERRAWVVSSIFAALLIFQAWYVFDPTVALRFSVSLVMVGVFSAICIRFIARQQDEMLNLAIMDPLTGLNNRVILNDALDHAVAQSRRTKSPCTLIVMDLDHFKSINDSYGHHVGDEVLQKTGAYLRQRVRSSDRVFRIGGEEFLIILYNTTAKQAYEFAEELRHGVTFYFIDEPYNVTTSIGVSELQPEENWESWVRRGDEQLYYAKDNGRNQVAVA